jgi:hypothetical protein
MYFTRFHRLFFVICALYFRWDHLPKGQTVRQDIDAQPSFLCNPLQPPLTVRLSRILRLFLTEESGLAANSFLRRRRRWFFPPTIDRLLAAAQDS